MRSGASGRDGCGSFWLRTGLKVRVVTVTSSQSTGQLPLDHGKGYYGPDWDQICGKAKRKRKKK